MIILEKCRPNLADIQNDVYYLLVDT